jgi:hypothetical protein
MIKMPSALDLEYPPHFSDFNETWSITFKKKIPKYQFS